MSSLSGGEQARVLIARLMLQPADVLLAVQQEVLANMCHFWHNED
jgi:ABC-type phosphate/phosphonate transport system ATPase subunit